MSDPHETPASGEAATGPDAHGSHAGHDDDAYDHEDHGHGGMALGPIDWPMWGVGVLGVLVALIVTAGFVVATGFQFNA